MDSPDQGAKDIPVTLTTFENPNIKFEITNAGIAYNGELKTERLLEFLNREGMNFLWIYQDNIIKKEDIKKPKEPTKPYPYYSEDVVFQNKEAHISLSGTLTLPKKEGLFPVVILITGSGPQDGNEELLGHKPF